MQCARRSIIAGTLVLAAFLFLAERSPALAQPPASKSNDEVRLKLAGEGLSAETLKKLSPAERIKAQLQRRVTLELNQGKLETLSEEITKQLGMNVVLDKKALEEAAFDTATPIDKVVSEPIELRHTLRLVLNDLALSYVVENDVLLITTKTAQENKQIIKKYPVGEFIRPLGSLPVQGNQDFDSLIQLIEATIQPTNWKSNGGQGDVRPFAVLDILVVSNTEEVHEQLEAFFAELRKIHAAKTETVGANETAMQRVVYPLVLPRPKQTKVTHDKEGKESVEVTVEGDARFTMEELTATIKKTIEPATWNDEKVSITPLGETLIITHTQATQRKVHQLLREMGLFPEQRPGAPHSNQNQNSLQPFGGSSTPNDCGPASSGRSGGVF